MSKMIRKFKEDGENLKQQNEELMGLVDEKRADYDGVR